MKKENKDDLTIPDVTPYYKPEVIKTDCDMRIEIDQKGRTDSPQINPYFCS